MLWHALYRLHATAAVTEYGGKGVDGIADVYGITESGYSYEIEVKCSKNDLAGELEAIRHIQAWNAAPTLGEKPMPKRSMSKRLKHEVYLSGTYPWRIPNRFYFVVPIDLREYALKALEGTPYGLFSVNSTPTSLGSQEWVSEDKDARHLHKEKVSDEVKENILRKSCTEIAALRAKIAGIPA